MKLAIQATGMLWNPRVGIEGAQESRVDPLRHWVEPFYTVMGFAASEHGMAILARASQKQVVNVAQRGGLAAVMVSRSVPEIGSTA